MDNHDDVELIERTAVYQGHFRVDRYRLRHTLFRGGWSQPINREVFERGHSVAVLPYDPVHDAVVLIEQFRIGPYACGEPAWMLEAIAGVVEPGEQPDAVARREAMEEAGCALTGPLQSITRFYVSPGGTSEHVEIFCGRCDCSGLGGIHGLAAEGEDIRVLVLDFAQAMASLEGGHLRSGPPVVALLWLALHRNDLRERWT